MKYIFIIFKAILTLPNINTLFKSSLGKDRDFLIINDNHIKAISQLFSGEIKKYNFLNKIKDKMINENHQNYYFNITNFFSEKTLNHIEKSLKDKNFLNNISNHFGYKLKFSKFMIRFNYYNPLSVEEYGAKMWHRDNDSLFNQLKFFLVLNDLSEDIGGYFYFIPQKYLPSHIKLSSQYKNTENFNQNDISSRIKNDDMDNKYKFINKSIKYGDDKTSALILNTNDTYHKGGFIKRKNGYRILLQAIYEPKYLSLSNYSRFNKNLLYRGLKFFLLAVKNKLRSKIQS